MKTGTKSVIVLFASLATAAAVAFPGPPAPDPGAMASQPCTAPTLALMSCPLAPSAPNLWD